MCLHAIVTRVVTAATAPGAWGQTPGPARVGAGGVAAGDSGDSGDAPADEKGGRHAAPAHYSLSPNGRGR